MKIDLNFGPIEDLGDVVIDLGELLGIVKASGDELGLGDQWQEPLANLAKIGSQEGAAAALGDLLAALLPGATIDGRSWLRLTPGALADASAAKRDADAAATDNLGLFLVVERPAAGGVVLGLGVRWTADAPSTLRSLTLHLPVLTLPKGTGGLFVVGDADHPFALVAELSIAATIAGAVAGAVKLEASVASGGPSATLYTGTEPGGTYTKATLEPAAIGQFVADKILAREDIQALLTREIPLPSAIRGALADHLPPASVGEILRSAGVLSRGTDGRYALNPKRTELRVETAIAALLARLDGIQLVAITPPSADASASRRPRGGLWIADNTLPDGTRALGLNLALSDVTVIAAKDADSLQSTSRALLLQLGAAPRLAEASAQASATTPPPTLADKETFLLERLRRLSGQAAATVADLPALIDGFLRSRRDARAEDLARPEREAMIAIASRELDQADTRFARFLTVAEVKGGREPRLDSFLAPSRLLTDQRASALVARFGLDFIAQKTPYLIPKLGDDGVVTYTPRNGLYYVTTPLTNALMTEAKLPIDPAVRARIEGYTGSPTITACSDATLAPTIVVMRDFLVAAGLMRTLPRNGDAPVLELNPDTHTLKGLGPADPPYAGNGTPQYGDKLGGFGSSFAAIIQELHVGKRTTLHPGTCIWLKGPPDSIPAGWTTNDPQGATNTKIASWDGARWSFLLSGADQIPDALLDDSDVAFDATNTPAAWRQRARLELFETLKRACENPKKTTAPEAPPLVDDAWKTSMIAAMASATKKTASEVDPDAVFLEWTMAANKVVLALVKVAVADYNKMTPEAQVEVETNAFPLLREALRSKEIAKYSDDDIALTIALAATNYGDLYRRFVSKGPFAKVLPEWVVLKTLSREFDPPTLDGFAAILDASSGLAPFQVISQFGLDYVLDDAPFLVDTKRFENNRQVYGIAPFLVLDSPVDEATRTRLAPSIPQELWAELETIAPDTSADATLRGMAAELLDRGRQIRRHAVTAAVKGVRGGDPYTPTAFGAFAPRYVESGPTRSTNQWRRTCASLAQGRLLDRADAFAAADGATLSVWCDTATGPQSTLVATRTGGAWVLASADPATLPAALDTGSSKETPLKERQALLDTITGWGAAAGSTATSTTATATTTATTPTTPTTTTTTTPATTTDPSAPAQLLRLLPAGAAQGPKPDAAPWTNSPEPSGLNLTLLSFDGESFSVAPRLSLIDVGFDVLPPTARDPAFEKELSIGGVSPRIALWADASGVAFGAALGIDAITVPVRSFSSTAATEQDVAPATDANDKETPSAAADPPSAGGPQTLPSLPVIFSTQLAYAPIPDDQGVQFHWYFFDAEGRRRPRITVPIAKSVGPLAVGPLRGLVDVESIVFGTDPRGDSLILGATAAIEVGALQVAIEDLRVTFPFKDPGDASVAFDGLAITFDREPIAISGALARVDDDSVDEFIGELVIRVKAISVGAMGSYALDKEGHPSLFVFALVDAPLFTSPYFQVTGAAGGFGYNRDLLLPTLDEVPAFPFVKMALGLPPPKPPSNDTPATTDPEKLVDADRRDRLDALGSIIDELRDEIPIRDGAHWFAAGIRFTSFEVIKSFALLFVTLGDDVKVGLLGLSTLAMPPTQGDDDEHLALAQLALEVVLAVTEGYFQASAKLTPASYVLSPDCHLTGGFAFYVWFKDQASGARSGDFVVTLGGYHPHFKAPSYYPVVPRLGFNWAIGDHLSIKGGMYFALTPIAVMAGGYLEAIFEIPAVTAWLKIAADFLIAWKPFHYEASIELSIGVRIHIDFLFVHIHISLSLGVSLDLWGPSFAGTAEVHLEIISFTISFGESDPKKEPIPWTEFKGSFLPPASAPAVQIAATGGLLRDLSDAPVVAAGKTIRWVLSAHDFEICTKSFYPSKVVTFAGGVIAPTADQTVDTAFGVGPCEFADTEVTSTHTVTLLRLAGNEWSEIQAGEFRLHPTLSLENLPRSLWSSAAAAAAGDPKDAAALIGQDGPERLIHGVPTGLRLWAKAEEPTRDAPTPGSTTPHATDVFKVAALQLGDEGPSPTVTPASPQSAATTLDPQPAADAPLTRFAVIDGIPQAAGSLSPPPSRADRRWKRYALA